MKKICIGNTCEQRINEVMSEKRMDACCEDGLKKDEKENSMN